MTSSWEAAILGPVVYGSLFWEIHCHSSYSVAVRPAHMHATSQYVPYCCHWPIFLIIYPEWPERQGGCLACWWLQGRFPAEAALIYTMHEGAQGLLSMRVGVGSVNCISPEWPHRLGGCLACWRLHGRYPVEAALFILCTKALRGYCPWGCGSYQ